MSMDKNFTLIYLYSNFEDDNILTEDLINYEVHEFEGFSDCLNKMIIKAPERIVNNIFSFAKMYS